jgi:hypothetical protein
MRNWIKAWAPAIAALPCICYSQTATEPEQTDFTEESDIANTPRVAPTDDLVIRIRTRSGYDFDTGFDGESGSLTRWNTGIDLGVTIPATDRLSFNLDIATGITEYAFSGATGLLPGDQEPWDTVLSHSFGFSGRYSFDKQNSMFVGLRVASDGDPDAEFEDTLTGGVFAGYTRSVSENLTLGVGLTAQTRLEDDPLIIPFPVILWKPPIDPERRWSISLGSSPGGPSNVAFAAVGYQASEQLSFFAGLGGAGIGGDFRLADDAGVPGGVGRDVGFPLVAGLDWRPRQGVRVGAYAGVSFERELELLDASGTTVSKRDVDPTPVVGLTASFSF